MPKKAGTSGPGKASGGTEQPKPSIKKAKTAKAAPRVPPIADDLYVVGVGASAGGLEALRPFVSHLPASSKMAYVIVQHLSPQYRSMMAQLLGRETDLKMVEITDGQPVQANTIYVTPPNRDVRIRNSTLWLREPSAPLGAKPSVDVFFVSLAEDKGQNAIGVILSGTGSDGSHGIRAIKAGTGFTVAQTPETAKYDGMPKSAIETGCIDIQLPPEQIGPELAAITQFPRRTTQKSTETAGRDTVDEIFRLVRNKTDVDFSQYKTNTIRRRLERRLAANRIESVEAYLDFVRKSPGELDLLCKDILISVTSFFRDSKAFEDLSATLEEILRAKKPGDSIRIWTPGCATGEEAYSIAMLLDDRLGSAIRSYNIQIFATDIDFDAMAHARRGIYSESTIENLQPGYITKYFDQMAQSYLIKKSLREMVVFARQDLAKDPPFVRLDLVSCRNVLIYFNADLQTRVLSVFHYALNPDGHLFLGKSENIGGHTEFFRPVKASSKIFKKRLGNGEKGGTPLFGQFRPKVSYPAMRDAETREVSYLDVMKDTFLSAYAPPSVVVNDTLDVLHFFENTESFIRLPRGKPELNLSRIVIDEFRTDVRVLVHRAARDNAAVLGSRKKIKTGDGEMAGRLVVRPLFVDKDREALFLVSCEMEKTADTGETIEGARMQRDADARLSELEQELVATRENLQTVVEELETSNEELQALNEELQAANEELQSSNEELETSNEELQSTNEELTTVNEELQVRTVELAEANTDLENIQSNVGFPLVVVDKALRVTRFTPPAVRLFGLLPSDIGQTITSIPTYADMANLRERLGGVIASGKGEEGEIEAGGAIYRMRIVPYRDRDDKFAGAIMSFIDETEIRTTQRKLRASEEWIRHIADSVPAMIAHIDGTEHLHFCNQPFRDWYGKQPKDVIGKTLRSVIGGHDFEGLKPALTRALEGESQRLERQLRDPDGNRRFMRIQFSPQMSENGKVDGCFAIITDIDDLKQAESDLWRAKEMAEHANRAKSDFLANMSHELRTPLNAILGFSEMLIRPESGIQASDKCREYAGDIHDSGRLLLALINDILDLAKIEAGKFDMDETEVDMHQATESAFRLVVERANNSGVNLKNGIPDGAPKLYADETAIKRVLLNLLTNAIKFTGPGGEVRVSAAVGGDAYVLSVKDTGVGIPPQDIDRITDPFEQVSTDCRRSREGVGLGLPITKSLLSTHGATLHIASELGKGTAVTVSFPAGRIRDRSS